MKIVEQKIILEQPADSDAENDIEQYMTVRALDCGAGPFVVIETGRWAIDPDEIEPFVALLRRLMDEIDREKE